MPSADRTAPGPRTRLTAGQRRESILEAAAGVFAGAGYRAAKMSDVAARVGVTEPVIFQNFGSKAALFAAVLERVTAGIQAELDAAGGDHGSAGDLLAHILGAGQGPERHGAHGAHGAHGKHRGILADAASLIADPAAGEAATGAARVIAGHLADLLRRGQAGGDIRPELDPEPAAWLLLSVLATRSLRAAAARPAGVEAGVADLTLRTLRAGPA